MFNLRKSGVRTRICNYLINASFDYAADCLEKENPTVEEIKCFVINDIKRVMDWRMARNFNILSQEMVIDYLQGLSLGVAYTYFDEWHILNNWTNESNDINKATDKELEKANIKYWGALSSEILRWDRVNRA